MIFERSKELVGNLIEKEMVLSFPSGSGVGVVDPEGFGETGRFWNEFDEYSYTYIYSEIKEMGLQQVHHN